MSSVTRYHVGVWVHVPNDDEDGAPEATKLELERRLFKFLKRFEYDCDCEVLDSERFEEP